MGGNVPTKEKRTKKGKPGKKRKLVVYQRPGSGLTLNEYAAPKSCCASRIVSGGSKVQSGVVFTLETLL